MFYAPYKTAKDVGYESISPTMVPYLTGDGAGSIDGRIGEKAAARIAPLAIPTSTKEGLVEIWRSLRKGYQHEA